MIISLLIVLLYAIVALICLEIVFYIVGKFFYDPPNEIPSRIRSLVYALVGVLFVIWIVQVIAGGSPPVLPPWRR